MPPPPRITAVVVFRTYYCQRGVFVWEGCAKSRFPSSLEKTGPTKERLKPLHSTLMLKVEG